MQIGKRLKNARLARGLTQSQLAEPEYTAAYVSTIEADKRKPSRTALEYFARKLSVDPDELATGRSPGLRAELLTRYVEARKAIAGDTHSDRQLTQSLKEVADRATEIGFPEIAAKARVGLGLIKESVGQTGAALKIYQEVEDDLADASPAMRVDAVVGRARILQARGEVALAAFLLEKLLAEMQLLGITDPSAIVRINASLIAAYSDRGLVKEAGKLGEEALELVVHVDEPDRIANLYLNTGIHLKNQGHFREAEDKLAEAERWFSEVGFEADLAKVQMVRGMALRDRGGYDEARQLFAAAAETFAATGHPLNEARAVGAAGINERLAGNLDNARFLLKRSLSLAGDDAGTEGIAHRELGLCDAATDKARAVRRIRKSISILEEAGITKELALTFRSLGDVLSDHRDLEPACDAYRAAADLFQQAA
jgi:tetratricopeptide (TPR) repeat protein